MMAERNCTAVHKRAPCDETARSARRTALEQTPMTRIHACPAGAEPAAGGDCRDCGRLAGLLEGQSKLLLDLLGAVNALAAAVLAAGCKGE